ncbi:hypothetical protein SeLEV6574_g01159 [Synchytrium endobioticum]|uniref:Threonine/serine exporter-like N-terminal domain-containing protein n=1 Tax=Synchytrium endobioticum TaxID=286115 RepID=A0A507DF58_9FUNG|nr:hypothetical protein SeLEV6574_g01159 [Synchytrium endobioticum]
MRGYEKIDSLHDTESPTDGGGDLSSLSKSRFTPTKPHSNENGSIPQHSRIPSPAARTRGSFLELAVLKTVSAANNIDLVRPFHGASAASTETPNELPPGHPPRLQRKLASAFTSQSLLSLSQQGPSSARLDSSTRLPRDSGQVKLLLALAKALATYGAPLYRVSHRVEEAAEKLKVPFGILALANSLLITTGDASIDHPTQTHHMDFISAFHVGKLQDVDRLARRTKHCILPKFRHSPSASKLPSSLPIRSSASSPDGVRAPPTLQRKASRASEILLSNEELNNNDESLDENPRESKVRPPTVDDLLSDLEDIISRPDPYPIFVTVSAQGVQSALLALILFKADLVESLVCFVLGAFTGVCTLLADASWLKAAEVLIPFTVAVLTRIFQFTPLRDDFCYPLVSLVSCSSLFPGVLLSIGMLELGSATSAMGGVVRVFQAFLRALKLGYGLSLGSRLVTSLAGQTENLVEACPTSSGIELWRVPFVFPLIFVVMIMFRAYPRQWLHISCISFIAFGVSLLSSEVFARDTATALAAFVLGLGANIYSRCTNDIAIGAILCGMIWLAPGSLGVIGARDLFDSSSELGGGTTFGIEMMTRAMSIAIGLYVANVAVFPLAKLQKEFEDSTA